MLIYITIIIFGLIIGSFLNVVILRISDFKSILIGRSECPHCKRKLSWYELFPLFSYIFLLGKCRGCKKPISIQYPLVEAGTALIFALIYFYFDFSLNSLFLILTSCILVVAFVYDILYQEIFNWFVISAAILWFIYLLIDIFIIHNSLFMASRGISTSGNIILNSLLGALALGGFLALLAGVSREKWMGYGDIGLGALLGFILGWPNVLVGGFLAFLIGAVVGLVLIALKQSKLQSKIPFAPFLILGFYIALFWGNQILTWYISLIKI